MKKFDISTSKLLLIILGVLMAIVIGFHSKAVGAKNLDAMIQLPSSYELNISQDNIVSNTASKVINTIRSVVVD